MYAGLRLYMLNMRVSMEGSAVKRLYLAGYTLFAVFRRRSVTAYITWFSYLFFIEQSICHRFALGLK